MESLPERLRNGCGFLMLRGLPRDRYSDDDMARIYFGLGAYIGTTMTQSYLGDLLGHVVDVSDLEPKSRGYRKGGGQLMHTDSCDIIGLMCLRTAISGGESRISSALTVHNWLAEHRPDLLEVLAARPVPQAHRRGRPARHPHLQRGPRAVLPRGERRGHLLPADRLCAAGREERPAAVHAARVGGAVPGAQGIGVARALPRHGLQGRRHPVPQQPHHGARPHRLRRRTRSCRSAATCCACGCASRHGRRCRRSRSSTPTRTCACGASAAAA